MDTSFMPADNSPKVYKIRLDKPSELRSLYANDILRDVCITDVRDQLAKYVTSIIEPVDWHAVWRPIKSYDISFNCDFEVEIIDVTHNTLEAIAVVHRLIYPSEEELLKSELKEIERILTDTKVLNIPLTELYVISEDDEFEQYLQTAVVIEHLRFFSNYIWRPWDDILHEGSPTKDIFVDTRLEPRLNLYFDVQSKQIPEATVNRIKNLIKEGWKIRDAIDKITKAIELPENEENDLVDESEILKAMRLKLRLEDIRREMKLLEDPHLRAVVSGRNQLGSTSASDDQTEPLIQVVAKSVSANILEQVLSVLKMRDPNQTVRFHSSFSAALYAAKSGDEIWVFPGVYLCDSLPWIDFDVKVKGFGKSNDDILIQSSDSVGDIFINCNSSSIEISDLTLRTSTETQCIIMVHSGQTYLKNCVLDGDHCVRNCIVSIGKSQVILDNTKIIHELKENCESSVESEDVDQNEKLREGVNCGDTAM